jgi:hypothetical protein
MKTEKDWVEITLRGGPELKKLHEQIGNYGFTLILAAAIFMEAAQRSRSLKRMTAYLLEAEFLKGLVIDLREASSWVQLYALGIDDLMEGVR